jgi:hypothetical protein
LDDFGAKKIAAQRAGPAGQKPRLGITVGVGIWIVNRCELFDVELDFLYDKK